MLEDLRPFPWASTATQLRGRSAIPFGLVAFGAPAGLQNPPRRVRRQDGLAASTTSVVPSPLATAPWRRRAALSLATPVSIRHRNPFRSVSGHELPFRSTGFDGWNLIMLPVVVAYLVLGVSYWLSSLRAFGMPTEVRELPREGRRRVQVLTALLTILLWPVALVYDVFQRLLR